MRNSENHFSYNQNIGEGSIPLNPAITFLYNLVRFGIKSGLGNITALLDMTDRPHENYPTIHVAGTNGKGSTSSIIASVLTASGYRTGLYTSPHLRNFTERIRIDGVKISESDIVKYIKLYRNEIIKRRATFFEATTAIAFKYFSDQSVDVAVIETGLGGRLDATNVLTPELSVITDIGIDHIAHLGKTIKKIAFEKGGIIKPGISCVTTTDDESALRELRRITHLRKSELIECDKLSFGCVKEMGLEGTKLDINVPGLMLHDIIFPLAGTHQIRNLRGALTALKWLSVEKKFKNISERSIRNGLSEIRANTGLRGRFEILRRSPLIIADVAHNPEGIRVLTDTLRKVFPGRSVVVFGVMSDKDYQEMIGIIAPIARFLIAATPGTARALKSQEIMKIAQGEGISAVNGGDTAKCIAMALNEVRKNEAVLLTGSHYLIGEAFECMRIIP